MTWLPSSMHIHSPIIRIWHCSDSTVISDQTRYYRTTLSQLVEPSV